MIKTHNFEKNHRKTESRGNKTTAIALAAIALGTAGFIKEKIDSASSINKARIEMETINEPKRIVKLDVDTTIFGVASQAVEKGYLDTDIRDASDFLTKELEKQMQASGALKPDERIDVGKLAPGTQLQVPSSWEAIGQIERPYKISAAIAEFDPTTGLTTGKIIDNDGRVTTFSESND